ncbi:hypothetical protein B0H19DRAFT_1262465 [Mycena capillaripes]|nr:hypothetical protein B0H19DRAFT_1262465 [Mycena capillaripes]
MSGTGDSSSPPSGSAVVPVPPPTAAKRKYNQIVSELLGTSARSDLPLDKLFSVAKFFPRGVNPFLDIGLVMFYGSDTRWAAPVSSDPSNTSAVTKKHTDAFENMVAISPDSIDVLREFYKDDAQ